MNRTGIIKISEWAIIGCLLVMTIIGCSKRTLETQRPAMLVAQAPLMPDDIGNGQDTIQKPVRVGLTPLRAFIDINTKVLNLIAQKPIRNILPINKKYITAFRYINHFKEFAKTTNTSEDDIHYFWNGVLFSVLFWPALGIFGIILFVASGGGGTNHPLLGDFNTDPINYLFSLAIIIYLAAMVLSLEYLSVRSFYKWIMYNKLKPLWLYALGVLILIGLITLFGFIELATGIYPGIIIALYYVVCNAVLLLFISFMIALISDFIRKKIQANKTLK